MVREELTNISFHFQNDDADYEVGGIKQAFNNNIIISLALAWVDIYKFSYSSFFTFRLLKMFLEIKLD